MATTTNDDRDTLIRNFLYHFGKGVDEAQRGGRPASPFRVPDIRLNRCWFCRLKRFLRKHGNDNR